MCFTIDQLDRACGILLLSESNAFIYCCKLCPNEFATGAELETHILFEHYDDEKKPLESIFVSDATYGLTNVDIIEQPEHQTESNLITFDESHIQPDVKEFSIISSDTIESNNFFKPESSRKSKRIQAVLSQKTKKTQQKMADATATKGQISTSETSITKHMAERRVQNVQSINTATEFVVAGEISIKTEQIQNKSPKISGHQLVQGVSYETQNEVMSIDESFQSSNGNSDYDDTTEVHIGDHSPNLEKSTTENEAPVKKKKKKRTPWKPRKGIFYCDMCPGVTFSTLEGTKAHMKRHIMNTLRKPCPLCMIRPRNMEKHMRIAHIEDKPYKCDFCDATFKHNIGRVSAKNSTLLNFKDLVLFQFFFFIALPGTR